MLLRHCGLIIQPAHVLMCPNGLGLCHYTRLLSCTSADARGTSFGIGALGRKSSVSLEPSGFCSSKTACFARGFRPAEGKPEVPAHVAAMVQDAKPEGIPKRTVALHIGYVGSNYRGAMPCNVYNWKLGEEIENGDGLAGRYECARAS
jgi:hypothetical protein